MNDDDTRPPTNSHSPEGAPGDGAHRDGDAHANVERLVGRAYRPDVPDPAFAKRVEHALLAVAREKATTESVAPSGSSGAFPVSSPASESGRSASGLRLLPRLGAAAAAAALAVGVLGLGAFVDGRRPEAPTISAQLTEAIAAVPHHPESMGSMVPRALGRAPVGVGVGVGETLHTGASERRRVMLPDGSVLYVNSDTTVEVESDRRVRVDRGEIYVEVEHDAAHPFRVLTPTREFIALGTRFSVDVAASGTTSMLVTHGRVEASGLDQVLRTGERLVQRGGAPTVESAERTSHLLDWTRDLAAAAASPLVPASDFKGGALITIDPSGQEARLSLRKVHVDVHIEDGFARTTIDQTYFNHATRRLEGTFYFPLPADASLSRLAMYVAGRRMEGGMAERERARDVFEQIVYRKRDPALLEWVDGSTFKMRVFPLEPREEKRIVLSYVQRLPSLYGGVTYRFPAGHSLGLVGDWSFAARVVGGAASWRSDSHDLTATHSAGDLLLTTSAQGVLLDDDVVLRLDLDDSPGAGSTAFRTFTQDGQQYLMARHRPDLPTTPAPASRDWILLFESSGARDPIVARAQVEVIRELLALTEEGDRFAVVTAATRTRSLADSLLPVTRKNVAAALDFLDHTHLVGAFDLSQALAATGRFAAGSEQAVIVHVGGGVATLGERDPGALARLVPEGAAYVGVAVGRRWSRGFMKEAARRTGGMYTQIDPTEPLAWRAFELKATLDTPRLLGATAVDDAEARFLAFEDSVSDGEELVAVTRVAGGGKLPESVTFAGTLDGRPWSRTVAVQGAVTGAGYLPRQWAKLEIDRLLAEDAAEHRDEIVALSKAMYVMSPFTSLLVLEDEAMYAQFKVDRGRSDHWALYDAPDEILLVKEAPSGPSREGPDGAADLPALLETILVRVPPQLIVDPRRANTVRQEYAGRTLTVRNLFDAMQMPLGHVRSWGEDDRIDVAFEDTDLDGLMSRLDWRTVDVGEVDSLFASPEPARLRDIRFSFPVQTRIMDTTSGRDFSSSLFRGPWPRRTRELLYRSIVRTRVAEPMIAPAGVSADGELFSDYYRLSWEQKLIQDELFASNVDVWDPRVRVLFTTREGPVDVGQTQIDFLGPFLEAARGPSSLLESIGYLPPAFPTVDVNYVPDELSRGLFLVDSYDPAGRHDGIASPLDALVARILNAGTLRSALQYQRPWINNDVRYFNDLLALAPGMNTSRSDVLSVVENEGGRPVERGTIDDGAARLIERARSFGWTSTGVWPTSAGTMSAAPISEAQVVFDGAGRFRLERTLPIGLREIIVCDGAKMRHLYPEIGVGSVRKMDRHQRTFLARRIPWLVPPAEDLAVGADVRMIDDHTVELVPFRDGNARVQMSFGDGGRLIERRLYEGDKQIGSVTFEYSEDGIAIRSDTPWGKSASATGMDAAAAPPLEGEDAGLVVLPLPFRTLDFLRRKYEIDPYASGNMAAWSQTKALALLGAHFATRRGAALDLVQRRFLERGDRRPGFFAILLAGELKWTPEEPIRDGTPDLHRDPRVGNEKSALAHYIAASADRDAQSDLLLPRSTDGRFLHELAGLATHVARWTSGRESDDGSVATRMAALEYASRIESPVLRWAALRLHWSYVGVDPTTAARMAELLLPMTEVPAYASVARYDRATALQSMGTPEARAEAREVFVALHDEALSAGALLPIDAYFTAALGGTDSEFWREHWLAAAKKLIADGSRSVLPYAALQLHREGDSALAEDLLRLALDGCQSDERTPVTLAVVEVLWTLGQERRAERLLEDVLGSDDASGNAQLWWLGAYLADQQGAVARCALRQERAVELAFRDLPDVVDLSVIRRQYGALLRRFQQLATAVEALGGDVPESVVERVVRATDRWRALDDDPTQACNLAAHILRTLGRDDLAWDYLTTPLAAHPNEGAPWHELAQQLVALNDIDAADRCFATAFEIEPTNAQFLWDRAEALRVAGRMSDARKVWRQLADGEWQPRFQVHQDDARRRLGR